MVKAKRRTTHGGLPRYVQVVRSENGDYYYFRAQLPDGRSVRQPLPGAPFDTDGCPNSAWWQAYRDCGGFTEQYAKTDTFAALIAEYKSKAPIGHPWR